MDAGFPDKYLWPLTFVAIGLLLVSLRGRRIGSSLLVGFIAGAAFYFSQIEWASLFLGPLPMSALAVLEALFCALGSVAITLAYRWMPQAWPSRLGRLALLPIAIGGLWTAREAWASVWPYGGFSWGRAAFSQSDSPFSPLFAWLGVSGVTCVMVTLVALVVELIAYRNTRTTTIGSLARATIAVGAITAVLVVPAWPVAIDGSIRVAAVQGNAKAGYFDRRTLGDNLNDQISATLPLLGQKVDVVAWPEGGSDLDPLVNAYAKQAFDYISSEFTAPLLAGTITNRGDQTFNTSMLWEAGKGEVDYYDKKHPVPFGEYIPDRAFWRPFAPSLIDLVGREYTPGTTDSVVNINGVIAALNICFDIVDDQLMNESVRQGARVLFAQSNNADFGNTDESVQQLAIARIRAQELGRSVVNISTVGTSAIIAPDGSIIDQLPRFTADAMVDSVPLSAAITPAVALGRQLEWFVSGLGLATLIIAFAASRTPHRLRDEGNGT